MRHDLFRQQAVDRLTSPDQLDRLMRVTSPKGWVALLALAGIIVAGVVWSIVGTVSTTVRAEGVLLRGTGTYNITAPADGRVAAIKVARGDTVQPGQVVAMLDRSGSAAVPIVNPFPGPVRVLEVVVDLWEYATPGSAVLNVEEIDKPLIAVFYLPASEAHQVRPGMAVRLSPAGVPPQTSGFLMGRVKAVAQFPSTKRGMTVLLENETLAQHLFAASGGTPVEVEVALPHGRTFDQLTWSTGAAGPAIESGTLASGDITVATQRPLSLVLPVLR
mgnify:CR=1 FL=1